MNMEIVIIDAFCVFTFKNTFLLHRVYGTIQELESA